MAGSILAALEVAEDRGCSEDMVKGKGKGEAEVAEDRGGDMVKGEGKGEGAKGSQPDAKRTRVRPIEDEGNGTMNEGNVAQSEGSDATPPPAKKARLLEGLRHDARTVERITGMRCAEVIEDEDQIEDLELRWIEQADTLGTCAVCGCCVDESGGCLRCQIVRLPEANEGSEAASEAAVEAVVEGAVEAVAEDRHASEGVSAGEPGSEPSHDTPPAEAIDMETLLRAFFEAMDASPESSICFEPAPWYI